MPPPSSPVSKLSLSPFSCVTLEDMFSNPCWKSFLTGEGGGVGRSHIRGRRESLVLYKSFNTLGKLCYFYRLGDYIIQVSQYSVGIPSRIGIGFSWVSLDPDYKSGSRQAKIKKNKMELIKKCMAPPLVGVKEHMANGF